VEDAAITEFDAARDGLDCPIREFSDEGKLQLPSDIRVNRGALVLIFLANIPVTSPLSTE
jgi:hypothetical protein